MTDVLDRGWHYATLLFAEAQIRTGHVLVAALKNASLKRDLVQMSKVFGEINVEALVDEARSAWKDSDEEDMRPMDGTGIGRAAGGRGGRRACGAGLDRAGALCGGHDRGGRLGQDGPDRRPG